MKAVVGEPWEPIEWSSMTIYFPSGIPGQSELEWALVVAGDNPTVIVGDFNEDGDFVLTRQNDGVVIDVYPKEELSH